MGDVLTSIIRTVTPIVAGAIITFFATKGITFDEELKLNLYTAIQALITMLYYIFVRLFEKYFPKFGWLLGSPKKPEYTNPEY